MFRPSNTKKFAVGVTSFAGAFATGTGTGNNKSASEFFPQQNFDTIRHTINEHLERSTFDLEKESVPSFSKDPLLRNPFTLLRKDDDSDSVTSALSELSDSSADHDPFLNHGLELLRTEMQSLLKHPMTILEGECAKETILGNLPTMNRVPIIREVQHLPPQRTEELFVEALQQIQSNKLMEEFHQKMLAKQAQQTLTDIVPPTPEVLFIQESTPNVEVPTVQSLDIQCPKGVVRVSSWDELKACFPCCICQDVLAAPVVTACNCNFCYSCINDYEANALHQQKAPVTLALQETSHFDCPHCKSLFDHVTYERSYDQLIQETVKSLPAGAYTPTEYTDWQERRAVYEEAKQAMVEAEETLKKTGEDGPQSVQEEALEWDEFKQAAVPVIIWMILAVVCMYRSYASAKK